MLYCSAIAPCHEAREFGRAREWMRTLEAWLDTLPPVGGATENSKLDALLLYFAAVLRARSFWS